MPQYCYIDNDDTSIITHPGNPFPLGAVYDGHGINFAIYSEHATKVQLCLFQKDETNHEEEKLTEYTRIHIKGSF